MAFMHARRHRLEAPANEKRGMLLHIKNDEHGELVHRDFIRDLRNGTRCRCRQTLPQGMRKV